MGAARSVALVAIVLLGLALRLDYAWEGRAPVYDAVAYSRIAANLDRGEGFTVGETATQPSTNYSPGLPLLVSIIYRASDGVHERLARVILALIAALAVPLTFLIGRRLSGPTAGLIGAAAVAVYPALLEYGGMLMSEPLATTLLAGAVLAMLWAGDGDRLRRWGLPGALLGALALTRPEYLGVAIVLAAVVFARGIGAEWRRSLGQAAVLVLGVVLVVLPWTVRNVVLLDRLIPISTGGGQVLFAGSYMPSGGDPERVGREVLERHPGLTARLAAEYVGPGAGLDSVLAHVRLEQILAALAAQRYPELENDRALARMGRERLWEDVTERPLGYAGFLAAKFWRVWGYGPREVMRRPGWEAFQWALLALGLIGLAFLLAGRRWEAIPILTVLVAITAISLLLVATPRRSLVMMPLVASLAGVGCVACADSLARRWRA
ncbi:MAG TPA: glycosyltransferase family 39 protein [Solirubrobacterales bacterium]|jgi:4-amino-4-deoxy-L-arabinose transferase-like glycosyltransferase